MPSLESLNILRVCELYPEGAELSKNSSEFEAGLPPLSLT